jgi:hypothetical protein
MAKMAADETILVATNTGSAPRDLGVAFPGAGATVLLGDAKAARDPQTGALRLTLPALSTSWIVPR